MVHSSAVTKKVEKKPWNPRTGVVAAKTGIVFQNEKRTVKCVIHNTNHSENSRRSHGMRSGIF